MVIDDKTNLDESKGRGADEIDYFFYQSQCSVISGPPTSTLQKSLSEGTFPGTWKVTYITPIFKAGYKFDVKN